LGFAAPPVWRVAEHGGVHCLRLPDAAGATRHLLIGAPADIDRLGPALAGLPVLPPGAWDWLQVQSAVPVITAATAEQFVPQMVNLEAVGGVNFQKGCYPGQEVVARSQYRGTLKRRMFPVHGEAALAAGDEVFHSGDPSQPAGMIVLAAAAPSGGHDALAELKLAALDGGTLHARAPDGPLLHVGTLPYALPTEV
ncbi:MAG: folate-binding protein, partial [Betaproteobacteria bacterium]|nr:folate-binding protein [Betaproteobacteria bacterium]